MKLTPTDHALAAFKAALNLIPLVGGSISSLVGDYVPLSTQAALEKAAELLREKLAHLEGRIDTEAVNKEDFAELFKSCELVITRTNRGQQSICWPIFF